MAKVLSDYEVVLTSLIQDAANKLSIDDRQEAIRNAVAEHSRLFPLTRRRSLLGSGSAVLSTPTGWVDEFSTVRQIEYPVGEDTPQYLDAEDWLLVSSPTASTTYQIRYLGGSIATSQRLNLEWTVPHVVSEITGTIADPIYRAVATLGASYACLSLAGYFTQSGDPMISIDSQSAPSKARDYMTLADRYRARYRLAVGLGPEDQGADVVAAGVFADVPAQTYQWGERFLLHPWTRRRW